MKIAQSLFLLIASITFFISTHVSAAWNVKPGWVDSVAVGGKCYCKSNFDHGIGNQTYRGYKVRDICRALGNAPRGGTPYNDIQCGHGPANSAADERACPGRVDRRRCERTKGPKWDWNKVERALGKQSNTSNRSNNANRSNNNAKPKSNTTSRPSNRPNNACSARGRNVGDHRKNERDAQRAFSRSCPGKRIVDCDPVNRAKKFRGSIWECSTKRLNY